MVKPTNSTVIKVYFDDGRVAKYTIKGCEAASAREHVHAIVMTGYRSTNNKLGTLVHYPPHRIVKVKAIGGQRTEYEDEWTGT